MKTAFVTGAEGFTGKHLVLHLKSRGYDVVGGVRNRGRKLSLEKQFGKCLVCDVSDAISVARAVASVKPDVIFHLAGASVSHAANREPLGAYQSIVTGWANVLDAARRSIPRCKVVLASAWDVYGNPGNEPVGENAAIRPNSTFGALKATAESLAQTFFLNYHLDITIARPFHYLGAGQSTEFFFGSVAARLAAWDSAVQGEELSLPDLNFRRDLLHVGDVVDAYEKLAQAGKPSHAYNICSGQTGSVREIVEALVAASGRNVRITSANSEEPADPASVPFVCGKSDKLTEHTGWRPSRTVRAAVTEMMAAAQTARQATVSQR